MFYHVLYPLHQTISAFNVFRYITFRTAYAVMTALIISWLIGPYVIRLLRRLQVGQVIRDDGPQSHLSKAGTPTMGGRASPGRAGRVHPAVGQPGSPIRVAGSRDDACALALSVSTTIT